MNWSYPTGVWWVSKIVTITNTWKMDRWAKMDHTVWWQLRWQTEKAAVWQVETRSSHSPTRQAHFCNFVWSNIGHNHTFYLNLSLQYCQLRGTVRRLGECSFNTTLPTEVHMSHDWLSIWFTYWLLCKGTVTPWASLDTSLVASLAVFGF
jgi:hypothetical protein